MTDAASAVEAATPPAPPSTPTPAPVSTPSGPTAGRPLTPHERGELTTGTPTPHPDDPDKPTRDAPKAEWLTWARDHGYDLPDDARTKDELVRDYGA